MVIPSYSYSLSPLQIAITFVVVFLVLRHCYRLRIVTSTVNTDGLPSCIIKDLKNSHHHVTSVLPSYAIMTLAQYDFLPFYRKKKLGLYIVGNDSGFICNF